jgi:hypothetical protein
MTDALMGFTLGLALWMLWKGARTLQERSARMEQLTIRIAAVAEAVDLLTEQVQQSGAAAADAAIAQLAARVGKVEKDNAAALLDVMDAAERVAHKLQDRRRKRETAESEGLSSHDEAPNDPAMALARARAFYGQSPAAAPADPSQLTLIREA